MDRAADWSLSTGERRAWVRLSSRNSVRSSASSAWSVAGAGRCCGGGGAKIGNDAAGHLVLSDGGKVAPSISSSSETTWRSSALSEISELTQ